MTALTHPTEPSTGSSLAPSQRGATVVTAAGVGAAIALSLGVYGRVHSPTGQAVVDFGFGTVLPMKAWLTTLAASLGLAQGLSALWLWGRLPGAGTAPDWLATGHRWLGTLTFFSTLPVAYHCLWSLGFQDTSPRVLVHSVLGCAFYGALATKLLALRSERMPGWALPLFGGALVSVLTGLWLTSSLWFFTTVGGSGL
ncbi:MAG: DUF6529 family protein [Acidimicrobiia bacterium]|nr:DUF6529 family protein [Acidimicrobiia bacterium]